MVGVGVFGTGHIAKVLIPLLRKEGFEVHGIWGRTTKEAEELARSLNIAFFTNKIDDVLLRKDVDLIFVLCQPFLHAEIAVKALGIGKHVVADKPGLTQADAMKMFRGAQYYPSLISLVNYSLRFLPCFAHMKRCLQESIIGPLSDISLLEIRVQMGTIFPKKFDWSCEAAMGGGILNLVGSHVVDLVNFLLQQQAVRVHAVVKAYTKSTDEINGIRQITAPDYCNFQMELTNGALVTCSLHSHTSYTRNYSQEVLVCGSKGYLVVRGGDLFVFKNKAEAPVKEEALYVDVQDLNIANTTDTQVPRPFIKGLCKMVGALKKAFGTKEGAWVKDPVQPAATFEDGVYVQAVLEAIQKSSETRSWQRVQIVKSSDNHEQIMRFARMSTM